MNEIPIKGLYLTESNVFEEDDNVKDNAFYFLKISKPLKVNCIVKKDAPEDESFDKDTTTEISELCQSSIELGEDFKLMPFPKKLDKDEKIYFIFFVENDEEEPDGYLKATNYYVERVSFPKLLETKVEPYELKISGEDTVIYLLKKDPENYNILGSFGDFPISIFSYKDKKFEKLGRIEENNYLFQLNEELELENGFAFVIFDNEDESENKVKFSFNFKLQLFNLDVNETLSKNINYSDFNTNLAFLQIHNKDKQLLKISTDYDYYLRVLDQDYKKLDKILDETFYKYIPQSYYYSKEYELFLVFPGYGKKGVTVETYNLSEVPTEIGMNQFTYFYISKDDELSFKVNTPDKNIILKLISDNTGIVDIGGKKYSFKDNKKEFDIDNKEETLTIKGEENDLILAIKTQIPDEYIKTAEDRDSAPVSTDQNEAFIAIDIDYNNYDYVSFYIRDDDWKIKYKRSTDFGLLTKNDYSINEFSESDSMKAYDLKYYKENNRGQNLTKLYYINELTNTSKIIVSTTYYKDLTLNYNEFIKIDGSFIAKVYKNYRLFLLTKGWGSAFLECNTDAYGVMFGKQCPFDILDSHYNCYAEIELEEGYIYAQPMEDDTEYYYDEYSYVETLDLKVINNTHVKLSFGYNFTSLTDYNFTFVFTEKKNERAFNTIISIFELFYLNNNYNKNQYEVYKFDIKDMQIDENNVASIALETPTKFNISDENMTFVYTLISESSPVKMFQIYDVQTYPKPPDDDGSDTPNNDDDGDKGISTALVVVFVIIGVLVLAVVAFLVLRLLRKNKSGLDSQVDDNKEMTLPMTDA